MARTSISLSALISFANKNKMDLSDMDAIKEAYREAHKDTDEHEAKRAYNRKMVSLCVIIPQGKGKEPMIITYHNEPNNHANLLTKAHQTAHANVRSVKDLDKVTYFVGEEMNLSEMIQKIKV